MTEFDDHPTVEQMSESSFTDLLMKEPEFGKFVEEFGEQFVEREIVDQQWRDLCVWNRIQAAKKQGYDAATLLQQKISSLLPMI